MADLGSLVIKILGDVKDVKKKLDTLDKRTKKTAKTTEKFNKTIKKGFQNFLKYTAIIGTTIMALRKLTSFVTSSIKAFNEQETAEAKLNATLEATGRFSIETRDKLLEFAEQMQKTTGVSDSLVIAAEGIMTTFTQINTKTFPEAISLANDMSQLFGQDLQQSVIQLGTALNDPIRGVGRLRRIGISFSETQKEMIAGFMEQNDIMSAQRVILDELQLELGGVAEAMGKTTAGQMRILKNEFIDFKEEVGALMDESMLPAFITIGNGLVTMLRAITGAMKDTNEALENWKATLSVFNKEQLQGMKNEIEDVDTTLMRHWNFLLGEEERLNELIKSYGIFQTRLRGIAKDELKAIMEEQDKVNESLEKNGIKLEEVNKQLDRLKRKTFDASEEIKNVNDDIVDLTDKVIMWNDQMALAGLNAGMFVAASRETAPALEGVNLELTNFNEKMWEANKLMADWGSRTSDVVTIAKEDWQELFDEQLDAATVFVSSWNTALDAIGSASDEFMNNRSMRIENDYQQRKQRILDTITDEIAQKEALEELDNIFEIKRRKLAREQAERDKKQAVFGAIINTALAVVKALGSAIPPLNFILAAIVGAAGAMQTAAIVARPLPALAEGGIAIKDTLARIGEGGVSEAVIPLSSEALKPFAQSIVGELQRMSTPGRPIVNQGNTSVYVQVGDGPIIKTVQRAMDNKRFRINAKAIK